MAGASRRSSRPPLWPRSSLGVFLALLLFAARPAVAEDALTLTLPRAPRQGEAVYLVLSLGIVSESREVDVETEDGRLIGLASLFAIPPGKPAGTYLIPVPQTLLEGTGLAVRFRIPLPGGGSRPARATEIRKAKLEIGAGVTPP